MMRMIKKHDDRRNEILDVAERIFHSKGYERCTINDILNEVGIAKGTFYHYFRSKEEALDAIVERNIEMIVSRVKNVIQKEHMDPVEKLMEAFLAMRIKETDGSHTLEDLHRPDNALLHQKNLSELICSMAPILAQIVEEGIKKEAWKCRYPVQFMRIYLAAAFTLTDEGFFKTEGDSQMVLMTALISVLEKMLEVPENSFMELFIRNWDK